MIIVLTAAIYPENLVNGTCTDGGKRHDDHVSCLLRQCCRQHVHVT